MHLGKSELIESIAAELGGATLRIARIGDWEALQKELGGMERTVRASGSAAYSAPAGKHDDLVWRCRSLCSAAAGWALSGGAGSRARRGARHRRWRGLSL
jgi:hypothetical protein